MDRVLSCTKDDCYLSSPAVDGPGKLNREASRLELECNAVLRVKSELERERAGEEAKRLRLRDVRRQLETLAEPLEVPTFEQKQQSIQALVSRILVSADEADQQAVRVACVFGDPARVIEKCTGMDSEHQLGSSLRETQDFPIHG